MAVAFDGRGSSDPEGDTLTYAWDLDGDGDFNDSTAATANFTYAKPGAVTVRLRVSDPNGRQGTASTVITAGGPPTVTISRAVGRDHLGGRRHDQLLGQRAHQRR